MLPLKLGLLNLKQTLAKVLNDAKLRTTQNDPKYGFLQIFWLVVLRDGTRLPHFAQLLFFKTIFLMLIKLQ
jgi:hypothetical protein